MRDKDTPETPASANGQAQTAATRLNQLQNHMASKPNTRKARRGTSSDTPADWSDVRGECEQVRNMARTPRSDTTGYQRHIASGKLWVRDRVEMLLDKGSFREIGSMAGTATWEKSNPTSTNIIESEKEKVVKFTPSNNVQGLGRIRGRHVVMTADDFTIRAGHMDGSIMKKTLYMEKLALSLKIPMIKLVDGSSGGGSITTYRTMNGSYIPELELLPYVIQQLDLGIPNCAAIVGPAVGLGAARATACHFSVMAGDIGALFSAGPKIVEGATFEEDLSIKELGGPQIHCTNGTIDNYAPNEKGCYEQIATFLSYLPDHGGVLPPVVVSSDPPDRPCPQLREIIPRRSQRAYSVRSIIKSLVDVDSFFEIGALWGRTVVVGLARMGGRPISIFADDPMVLGGALDTHGCQKLSRHLKLCDVMGIPLVQLIDIPGFAIGTVAEKSAVMRWAMEMSKVYHSTTMPVFSIIIRRCFGIGGGILADNRPSNHRVAWPSANTGSIPLDGGIEVNHRAELKRAGEKRDELYKKLEAEYLNLLSVVRLANRFGIEEIIDPANSRVVLCEWTEFMYQTQLPLRLQQRASGIIRPSFR